MNIAEILKHCETGMKLYSPIYGDLSLESVYTANNNYPIYCSVLRSGKTVSFTKDGRCHKTDAEPTLFPSKTQRDWSKFVFTDKKTKCQLKPFDKVLVRNDANKKWSINLFSYYDEEDKLFPYVCLDGCYHYCIPYADYNKHVLGTTINPNK